MWPLPMMPLTGPPGPAPPPDIRPGTPSLALPLLPDIKCGTPPPARY